MLLRAVLMKLFPLLLWVSTAPAHVVTHPQSRITKPPVAALVVPSPPAPPPPPVVVVVPQPTAPPPVVVVPPPPPPPPPTPVATTPTALGITPAQIAAWSKVDICEEGGNWHVVGAVYSGGLGFSNVNWTTLNTFGFPATAAAATPDQQVRVAVAFAVRYYGTPNAAPDQPRCGGGY